jgi:hypothetical protein
MPKAEITSITTGRRVPATDPQSDEMAVLREIARSAAELGVDPSAAPHPDHELLGLCDQIVMLRRQADAAYDAWWLTPFHSKERASADYDMKRANRALRPPLVRAGNLRATTAAGLYAKAVAVSKASDSAAKLGKSLALDLLASAELRAVLWPAVDA